jgi:phenylacetate-coenzyme A ligase PaaK-like adenylate-forming protein
VIDLPRAGEGRFQGEEMKKIVRRTFEEVPLYSRVFRSSGFDPGTVKGLDDLSMIPMKAVRSNVPCPLPTAQKRM